MGTFHPRGIVISAMRDEQADAAVEVFAEFTGAGAEIAAVDQALDTLRRITREMTDRDGHWATYVIVLGIGLRVRFDMTGDPQDLQDAVRLVEEAIEVSPEEHHLRLWSNVADSVWQRAQHFGHRQDLDQAIELTESLLPELTDDEDPLAVEVRSQYADMMSARYAWDFDVADLDEAITLRRGLLSSSPLDEEDRPAVLFGLGHSLHARFERRQRPTDLDEAIAVLTEAMAYDDPIRPVAAFELNGSLLQRFLRTRDPADVDAAVDVARSAFERETDPGVLAALSRALGMRFEIGGVPADLDEAIDTGRAAIASTPQDDPDSAGYRGSLAVLVGLRAAQTRDPAELDEAVEWGQQAVALTRGDSPSRGLIWHRFGTALRVRGTPEDLDRAVEASSVAAGVLDSQMRWQYLYGLSLALHARFAATGDISDLTDAIAALTTAVDLEPPDPSQLLAVLGDLHIQRYDVEGDPEDLDLALGHARLVRGLWAETPDFLLQFSRILWIRYELAGRAADREEAIGFGRRAVAADPNSLRNLRTLGMMLNSRYSAVGNTADLDEAVAFARRAVTVAPHDEGPMADLARSLWSRFYGIGNRADVDETIALGEQLVAMDPAEEDLTGYQALLGMAFRARFDRFHDLADRAAAETWERLAAVERDEWADGVGPEHGEGWAALRGLRALGYLNMATESDDPSALDRAIVLTEEVVGLFPDGHPGQLQTMANLVTGLWTRFTRRGDVADLDRAIGIARAAVAAGSGPDVQLALGNVLHARYTRFGQPSDLDDAITAIRAALDDIDHADAPDGDADGGDADDDGRMLATLANLGLALRRRFELTGQVSDLTEAIEAGRAATQLVTGEDSVIPLSNHSATVLLRFRAFGDQADLAEAIALGRAAVAAGPPGHPDVASASANLGFALTERSPWSAGRADLDEAIERIRAAVAVSPPGYAELPMYLSGLGLALLQRYDHTGDLTDLNDGVEACRAAVEAIAADHPERPRYLSNLAFQLRRRFGELAEQSDLDGAVAFGRAAVEASPADHPERPLYLMNLASTLLHGGFDADEAVRLARAALAGGPADHPAYLGTLADALQFRFAQTDDPADLDEAVSLARASVAAAPVGHHDQLVHLTSLNELLLTRGSATRSLADMSEAVSAARAVVDSAKGTALLARARSTLARALQVRYHVAGEVSDLDAALAVWRGAAEDRLASPANRLRAGQALGVLSAMHERWSDAVDGYAIAVEMMPLAAWRGAGRSSREHLLTQYAGLGPDAAACAIAAGDLGRAIELLEHGRGVLWSQTLETRTDLTALREAAPALAARLSAVRSELDAAETTDQQMRLAVRWDSLIRDVRALDGFASFLRPPAAADLRTDKLVVVVNASRYRCDALLVTGETAKLVELPIEPEALAAQAASYLDSLQGSGIFAEVDIVSTLEWLWDNVTAPILDAVHDLPERLWWCPTGLFSLLPLHAAGYHEKRDGRSVLDHVVSSYTPTLRSLVSAGTERRRAGDNRMLIVAMPETPGQPPLPNAARERDQLTRLFATPRHTLAEGGDATHDSVLAHLRTHAWAHFSCHADQQLDDPSQGGLLLHDRLLTVNELANSQYRGEFAFLSACKTAVGGVRVPDEALTLAAALQYTGWRHVIGTLWLVWDDAAANVASDVYNAIAHQGELRPDRAAQALHAAVLRQRDATPDGPGRWAPFIHIGP
jgi:tetratricopeptide (TPR) repeat protein